MPLHPIEFGLISSLGSGLQPIPDGFARVPTTIATVSLVNSATATAGAGITLMTGIEAGDLLVLFDILYNDGGGDPATAIPTSQGGWTDAGTAGGSPDYNIRVQASYLIADGTEDGATVTPGLNGDDERKIVLQYRANVPIRAISVSTAVSTITGGNPATQTIAASAGTAPVIGIATFSNGDDNTFTPRTSSITPDTEILVTGTQGGTGATYLHSYIQNSSPANYTFDMTDEGFGNVLFGFYIHNLQAV